MFCKFEITEVFAAMQLYFSWRPTGEKRTLGLDSLKFSSINEVHPKSYRLPAILEFLSIIITLKINRKIEIIQTISQLKVYIFSCILHS